MSVPAAGSVSGGHIVGLDVWRALLMLGGLFVHASIWLEPVALFRIVETVSGGFRMGAFFAISGFLSAMVLTRRDPREWLRMRIIQLGIPAIVGVGMLSPLIWGTAVLALGIHKAPGVIVQWYHLWFLFGLLPCSMVAVLLHLMDVRYAIVARLFPDDGAERPRARVAMLWVAVCSAVLLGITPFVMRAVLAPPYLIAFANIQLIAGLVPMFVFGFLMARSPTLREGAYANYPLAAWTVALTLGGCIATEVAVTVTPGAFVDDLAHYARAIAAAACPPAAFVLIWRSASRIRRVPPFVVRLADASYTIYVLHLPIAAMVNVGLRRIGCDPHISYVVCIVVTGALSFAAHVVLVSRSPVLALLLNGKLRRGVRGHAAIHGSQPAGG